MSAGPDLQPDELEALQAETVGAEPPVRVQVSHIETPIRTQDLPRKAASTNTFTVGVLGTNGGLNPAKRVLSAQPRRALARLVSTGQAMLVAFSQAAAQQASTMALWPAGTVLNITHDAEVYVASATGTTQVTVIAEFWATGD
jgi:hypothetical protein